MINLEQLANVDGLWGGKGEGGDLMLMCRRMGKEEKGRERERERERARSTSLHLCTLLPVLKLWEQSAREARKLTIKQVSKGVPFSQLPGTNQLLEVGFER